MALNLNKLFVRVPGDVTIADVSALSKQADNLKKIYFLEKTNLILNNGIVYGVDPTTISSIKDLQTLVGATSISDSSANGKSVIERLLALEAIKVKAGDTYNDGTYITVTKDASNIPVIDLNIVDITSENNGLVDNKNAKLYIDEQVAEATTEVVEGKGTKVTSSSDNIDGHTVYTVDASLSLEYVAAVTEGETTLSNALIKLTDGNGNSFGSIDVANIIGNGILKGSSYNQATGILTLTFAEADGTPGTVEIDLRDMLDLGDLMVKSNSTNYLNISTVDSSTDVNQAQFEVKIADVSTAADGSTGLVDAYNVKQYILSQTTDLSVDAQGDDYITAAVDANINKKINVTADVQNLTATAGTPGSYDAEGAQTTAPTHATLTGVAKSLTDGDDVATKVKTYVEGELAIEAARSNANTLASIKALDANVNSTGGTNVTVNVVETDGKVTGVTVGETYATIRYDADTNTWTNTTPAGLVTGTDMNTMKSYVDDKVADSEISATGDGKYIDASVDTTNKKLIHVAANTANLGFNDPSDSSATLTGTANTLVDGAELASKVTSFVNARIAEDIDTLDSTITLTDVSNYVSTTVVEDNGKLASSGSSLSVQYGTMGVSSTNGIAKAEEVQTFVDTYDFWETYQSSSNNG